WSVTGVQTCALPISPVLRSWEHLLLGQFALGDVVGSGGCPFHMALRVTEGRDRERYVDLLTVFKSPIGCLVIGFSAADSLANVSVIGDAIRRRGRRPPATDDFPSGVAKQSLFCGVPDQYSPVQIPAKDGVVGGAPCCAK